MFPALCRGMEDRWQEADPSCRFFLLTYTPWGYIIQLDQGYPRGVLKGADDYAGHERNGMLLQP